MSDKETKDAVHGGEQDNQGMIPFYPMHMMKEIMVVLGMFAALLLMASFLPAHLAGPADRFNTPAHVKPEWYFLAAYQALKYFPAGELFRGLSFVSIGILLINGAVLFMFVIPFIDFYKGKAARRRPAFLALGLIAVTAIIILIYLGHYSGHVDPIFHRVFR